MDGVLFSCDVSVAVSVCLLECFFGWRFMLADALLCRVMNLYMNGSVETCQGLLSTIGIQTASVLLIVSSLR